MGKKKKGKALPQEQQLKLNKERLHILDTHDVPAIVTAEDFNLPQTLGNPPKNIRKSNDMAFDSILPQIEGMLGAQNMLRCLGGISGALFPGFPTLVNLSQNALIRAGVEMRGNDMVRKWGELKRKGNGDVTDDAQQEVMDKLTEALDTYRIRKLLRSASCKCGYLGGCLLFIDTGEPDRELVNPLLLNDKTYTMGSLRGFRMIEPFLVTPGGYNSSNPTKANYFKPDVWYVQGIPIHTSRLIYFAENELSTLLKPAYNFFGLSLAQTVLDAVAHFTQNRESACRLLNKYALTVLKTNMGEVLSGGFDTSLRDRVQYFVQNRSNDGCATIDKEQEDLVVMTTSLAGVVDVVRQSMEYVAALFNEPVTKMWGLSPNGFSTGDAELQNHYDNIATRQEQMFAEPMRRILRILQMDIFGTIDESIIFEFAPLSEKDERSAAETNKIQAETDAVNIQSGVISPQEARQRVIADPNSGYNNLTEEPEEIPEEVEPFDPNEDPEETEERKEVTVV